MAAILSRGRRVKSMTVFLTHRTSSLAWRLENLSLPMQRGLISDVRACLVVITVTNSCSFHQRVLMLILRWQNCFAVSFPSWLSNRYNRFKTANLSCHVEHFIAISVTLKGGKKGSSHLNFNRKIFLWRKYVWNKCRLLIVDCFEQALTHYGLVTPYGDRDLVQHWLR